MYKIREQTNVPEIKWVGDWERSEENGGPLRILVLEQLGENLEERMFKLPEKKYSLATTIDLALQVFDIIKVVHENNQIHRDIKP